VTAVSTVVPWFAKGALPKSISVTILTSTGWRTLGLPGAFPTSGGTIPWALRFLAFREIDCGN